MNETLFTSNTPNILIVDDVLANLELLSGILQERGYITRPVLNGKTALMTARADPPDLILLDVNMPEMDGYEVCERLKGDDVTKDIPVIFITASNETEEKVRAFSMGAVDFVTKPFQVEEVVARVRTHLNIRSLQCRLAEQNENLELLVAKRTLQLAKANSLKNDFLRMISHELRTPANGILGMGEMILDLCPPSEELTLYAGFFQDSSARLLKLIEDATLIVDLDNLVLEGRTVALFDHILEEVKASHPDLQISADLQNIPAPVYLHWNRDLLKRAVETLTLLAASFSKDKQSVNISATEDNGALRLRLDLDAISFSDEAAANFFKLECTARSASPAESLGLAPVAAHSLISAFGGELRMAKVAGNTGFVEVVLPIEDKNHTASKGASE